MMTRKMSWLPCLGGLAAFAIVLLSGAPAPAQSPSSPFEVARLVVCADVQDRSPVDIRDVFPAETQEVFCFLEARDIQEATDVKMVWYHEEAELASVSLTVGQGPRWRTYSSKQTMGRSGNWKVYLVDSADNILASVQFAIE
jgi:hypothetical protein